MDYTLKVFISARDRTHLTQKCIESLHEGCVIFNKIKIYLFDNLSNLTEDRSKIINEMIEKKLIHYYSYDTDESLSSCFGKVICFQRWIKMMQLQESIHSPASKKCLRRNRNRIPPPEPVDNLYYMLVDNDMVFRKGWDEYFISAADSAKPSVHFLVPWPGGCPGAEKRKMPNEIVQNKFGEQENINVIYDFMGGASGMWFMTPTMLPKLRWEDDDILAVYKRFKRHDSMTWRLINRNSKGDSGKSRISNRIMYVLRVKPPSMDNPFILHLGGVVGSFCNALSKMKFSEQIRSDFEKHDEDVKDMTATQLFDTYKDTGRIW